MGDDARPYTPKLIPHLFGGISSASRKESEDDDVVDGGGGSLPLSDANAARWEFTCPVRSRRSAARILAAFVSWWILHPHASLVKLLQLPAVEQEKETEKKTATHQWLGIRETGQ